MTPKLRILLIVIGIAFPVDQLCKFIAESQLALGARVPVIDSFFYLVHARNAGAAFGLFASTDGETRLLLFGFVSIASGVLIAAFFRRLAPGDRAQALGLSLVLAGGAANFADRVWRGEVIDYMHLRLWPGFAWPDFNTADVCIVAGVLALVIDLLAREAVSRSV